MDIIRTLLARLQGGMSGQATGNRQSATDFHARDPRGPGTYREQFEQAAHFSAALGTPVGRIDWLAEPALRPDRMDTIEHMLREAGVRDLRDSAAQCLKWSAYLAPYVERAFGMRATLTVGQLWRGQKPVYDPTWQQLRRLYEQGFTPEDFGGGATGMNFHAWLTLATGEILDFTLLSSLAAVVPDAWGPLAGHALGGYPEAVFEHHHYVPMVLGSAYAERLNSNSPVPLLATGPDDLPKFPMFIAAVGDG